jgi:hypothetical protein
MPFYDKKVHMGNVCNDTAVNHALCMTGAHVVCFFIGISLMMMHLDVIGCVFTGDCI